MSTVSRALSVTLLSALAAAVVALPFARRVDTYVRDPLSLAVWELTAADSRHSNYVRRAHSELVAAAAERAAVNDQRVTIVRNDAPNYFVDGIRAQIERQLSALPRHDPRVRIVASLVVDTSGTLADAPVLRNPMSWSADVFVPDRPGDTICTVVVRAYSRTLLAPAPRRQSGREVPGFFEFDHDMLGPCAWYAAYGVPSTAIRAWLDSTNFAPVLARNNWLFTQLSSDSARGRIPVPAYSIFQGMLGRFAPRDHHAASCAAGRNESCLTLFSPSRSNGRLHPARDVRPGRARVYRRYDPSLDGSFSFSSMIALQLEREVGAEGFAAFWTSEVPLTDAFLAVRRVPLADWIQGHMEIFTGGFHAGPLPRPRTNFALLITIPALLGMGIIARKHGLGGRV